MADDVEVLLQMYREQHDQARQLETQRATLSNLIIVIASAALGFTAQHGLETIMLVVTLPMVGLGVYGVLACLKYHERSVLHHRAARLFSCRIEERLPSLLISDDWAELHARQRLRFPKIFKVRLYALWIALHAGIAASGATLSAVVFAHGL
ncbi:hypothetical protein ACGFT2_15830 [Streptomyces sp. NPDC048514]|uniref:hypothetical protein n=1 Tax=Streptomyces sp. NPDC048514 TaxID=3365564 RepID=UPI0037130F47